MRGYLNEKTYKIGRLTMDIKEMPVVMGILNVTPDSFSDGGLYTDIDSATRRAIIMESEGAKIIDIGGESTRPGADPVDLETELKRVIPVIKSLRERSSILISIDTYKAKVAEEAILKGADIVNDISGLRQDKNMVRVVADSGVPVVIMHMKGTPKDMQKNPFYRDVVQEIIDFFKMQIDFALGNGVSEDQIILDPGIGFGKTLEHNLTILANLDRFRSLGFPLLVGVSRKSFIGTICDIKVPKQRVYGTIGAVILCALKGTEIVRVHDVRPIREALQVVNAIKRFERD